MPGHPQILTNRGHALRRLDRPEQALVDFAAALGCRPEFAEAHFEAAMARLTLGDFARGWKQYEWRWKTGAFARHRRSFRQPLWLGNEPIAGKTILLHAEQGFGDTIQFIRYAPLLAGQGANVICEVQPELKPLLSQLADVSVIAQQAKHCRHSTCIVRCSAFPWRSGRGLRRSRLTYPISRRGQIAWRIGASACRPTDPARALSGPARRRTKTTPTVRSRSHSSLRCSKIHHCDASAFRPNCAPLTAKHCANCRS